MNAAPNDPGDISQRFVRASLATAIVALLMVTVLLAGFQYAALRSALDDDARAEAAVIADTLSASLMFRDERAANDVLASLRHSPAVTLVSVYDTQNVLFAQFSRGEVAVVPDHKPHVLTDRAEFRFADYELTLPIRYREVTTGHLHVVKSLRPMYGRLALFLLATMVIVLGVLALARLVVRRARQEIGKAEEKLHVLAHVDAVTGLENRHAFNARLVHAVELARRFNEKVAVIALDLDNFKSVNDTLGHQAGDELLRLVAHRLRDALRRDDTISRLGGDEFSVILPRLADEGELAVVGEKIIKSCSEPYRIGGREFFVTTSVGIAVFPDHAIDAEALVGCSDRAMYRAKQQGKNTWVIFSADMNEGLVRRVAIENALWQAVARNEIDLHYQPQFAADGKRVLGAEALMRWRHPEFGNVSPADFIPIAERNGQIVVLGEWALRRVAQDALQWRGVDGKRLRVAVNVSARQFGEPAFVELVAGVLRESGLPPECLEIELTESVLMENISQQMETMARLRALGVELAIDDFGTGYSSMAYLRNLPVDRLKIDRAFVRDLPQSSDVAIVRAMVSLAHNLGLEVVAEGVETEAQRALLEEIGVDVLQGYLLARPQPLEHYRGILFAG